jgi:hypothetical protein
MNFRLSKIRLNKFGLCNVMLSKFKLGLGKTKVKGKTFNCIIITSYLCLFGRKNQK